ncbi:hypothetical protein [Marivirga sp.]|uniref:hypothetical protein n=1 Tax=Marivirga sp. TaxID=2018662 RepID=UPI003DA717A5
MLGRKSFLLIALLIFSIQECFSQSIVKDFLFYSYGSNKITSYHRNVFGSFQISPNYIGKKDTLLFELDFTDNDQDTIYHLESSKIMSPDFMGDFSIGRNSIHIGTEFNTWSSRHPNLYNLKVSVTDLNHNIDTIFSEIIGIRDLYWVDNEFIINQEDSILKAFELDTLISDLTTLHTARSVFANSIFLNDLPSESVMGKCDSLGIYVFVNTNKIKSRVKLEHFLKANQNSPSLVAFYKLEDNEHSPLIKGVLKGYRNFKLLDKKPENLIQSPFKIYELNGQRIKALKERFNPFKFKVDTNGKDSIIVKIDLKQFGSYIQDFKFEVNFYDLEGFNFKSSNLNHVNYHNNSLELNIKIPDNISIEEFSKVKLLIYPSYSNYWFNEDLSIIQLDIY